MPNSATNKANMALRYFMDTNLIQLTTGPHWSWQPLTHLQSTLHFQTDIITPHQPNHTLSTILILSHGNTPVASYWLQPNIPTTLQLPLSYDAPTYLKTYFWSLKQPTDRQTLIHYMWEYQKVPKTP